MANKKLEAHPYANLFPMMSAVELEALSADIAENGLRQPIVLYQGKVLDGRNRLLACERADVEPTFTEYDGDDPLGLVISLNVQRRDLTAAQRAIVAARALPAYEEEAKKRQEAAGTNGKEGGRGKKKNPSSPEGTKGFRSTEVVGAKFKAGKNQVSQAKALLEEAPDLAEQVESCTSSLPAAYEVLQDRRKQAAQKARDAQRVAEFKDAISSGEMTLDDALQTAIEQEREEKEKEAALADARRQWLKSFAEHLRWFTDYVCSKSDEYLAWYTEPDSPGLFDHGITPEQIAEVIKHLERSRVVTFKGKS